VKQTARQGGFLLRHCHEGASMTRANRLLPLCVGTLLILAELPLLAHAGDEHAATWWGFVLLGRLHVLVVHFPIALIVLIGLIEVWRWWRRDQTPNALLLPLSILTACSAVIAAGMGWLQASSMAMAGAGADLLQVHRWTGTTTAAVAVLMAFTRWRLERAASPRLMTMHRSGVAVGVILVAVTGHVGGLLVHGDNYLSSAMPWARAQPTSSPTSPTPTDHENRVVFVRDILPVLSASCLECHGPAKQQADLRVDSRAALLSGGETGPAIILGRGDDSLLVQRLRGQGGEPRMPKKKEPIPDATIAVIVRWIDEGALWPDGVQMRAP
jgi:uncharacterized membrane protein